MMVDPQNRRAVKLIFPRSSGPLLIVSLLAFTVFLTETAAFGQPVSPRPPDLGRQKLTEPLIENYRPDDGLTVDQAVDRFLKENLELRAMRDEITMAQADVEAAGQPPQAYLLINVGLDGIKTYKIQPRELVPRSGINTLVARAAKRVIEAQYQDTVRTRIDSLYTEFVDVQAAQMSVGYAELALRGMDNLLEKAQELQKRGQLTEGPVGSAQIDREIGAAALAEAKITLRRAKLVLANLLNIPDAEADQLKSRLDLEGLRDRAPAPPVEELIRIALSRRPDVRAFRLGLYSAQVGWLKALVEPLSQITVRSGQEGANLAGPKQGGNAAASNLWAIITLPTTVRNQGALQRAAINVTQTRTELTNIEHKVILAVRLARLDYEVSCTTFDRFRNEIIPNTRSRRDNSFRQWQEGEASLKDHLEAQSKYNDAVGQFTDAALRLRRAMLALNTAVGERIMP
jgi:cobalt-zinc-cadmium efflux system outer membrane protein